MNPDDFDQLRINAHVKRRCEDANADAVRDAPLLATAAWIAERVEERLRGTLAGYADAVRVTATGDGLSLELRVLPAVEIRGVVTV